MASQGQGWGAMTAPLDAVLVKIHKIHVRVHEPLNDYDEASPFWLGNKVLQRPQLFLASIGGCDVCLIASRLAPLLLSASSSSRTACLSMSQQGLGHTQKRVSVLTDDRWVLTVEKLHVNTLFQNECCRNDG